MNYVKPALVLVARAIRTRQLGGKTRSEENSIVQNCSALRFHKQLTWQPTRWPLKES